MKKKQDPRNVYAREYYKRHRAERIASTKKYQAKTKAEAAAVFTRYYASPFDNFFVQLSVGPAKAFMKEQPGVKFNPSDKGGATITTPDIHGVLVWFPEWKPTAEHIAALFHEMTHAAFYRFEKNGILLDDQRAKSEFVAYSVEEFGRHFLEVLNGEFCKAGPDGE